jgi:hypothetical protein
MSKKFLSWWNDGISLKETIALLILGVFGYLVYFACKKMMGVGLTDQDIELVKVISTQILIILCFYYGGGSANSIIQSIFNKKINNTENE